MHTQTLEKREEELQRELYEVRQVLRLTRQVQKCKDTLQNWQRNGVPDPRRSHPSGDGNDRRQEGGRSGDAKLTRKERILSLLAQDPQRRWKARHVADGLNDPQLKSVRVALDEMMRAGAVLKHEDAHQAPERAVRPSRDRTSESHPSKGLAATQLAGPSVGRWQRIPKT
ncbi:hypothetical protein [Streptomyces sp. 7N604]|uniref:hypothetical protein n=1 Tax=Streptomyces sp. 7N604 TaxID=3457415 RepID=UPI003FD0F522